MHARCMLKPRGALGEEWQALFMGRGGDHGLRMHVSFRVIARAVTSE